MSRGRAQAGQAARVPANETLALKLWPHRQDTTIGFPLDDVTGDAAGCGVA